MENGAGKKNHRWPIFYEFPWLPVIYHTSPIRLRYEAHTIPVSWDNVAWDSAKSLRHPRLNQLYVHMGLTCWLVTSYLWDACVILIMQEVPTYLFSLLYVMSLEGSHYYPEVSDVDWSPKKSSILPKFAHWSHHDRDVSWTGDFMVHS